MVVCMRRKGFSLIEMCIVMSIIGILVATILIGAKGLRARANDTKTKGDVRSLGLIMVNYFTEHKQKYPISKRLNTDNGNYYPACYEVLNEDSSTAMILANKGQNIPQPKNPTFPYYYCSNSENYEVIGVLQAKQNYIFKAKDNQFSEQEVDAPHINMFKIDYKMPDGTPATAYENGEVNIKEGDEISISWQTDNNVAYCNAESEDTGWNGPVQLNKNSLKTTPQVGTDKDYELVCPGFIGTADAEIVKAEAKIKVNVWADPTLLFTDSLDRTGDPINRIEVTRLGAGLKWTVTNASECTRSEDWESEGKMENPVSDTEDITFPSLGNFTYGLACKNPLGIFTAIQYVYFKVIDPPGPVVTLMANGSTVSPQEVEANIPVNLRWNSMNTLGAQPCEVSWKPTGSKWPTTGNDSIPFSPGVHTVWVECVGQAGLKDKASILINSVIPAVDIKANGMDDLGSAGFQPLFKGDRATLTWTSKAVVSCLASGNWSGNKVINNSAGILTQPLEAWGGDYTYTYRLTCNTKNSGTVTDLVKVRVIDPIGLYANGLKVLFVTDTASSVDIEYKPLRLTVADKCIANGEWAGSKTVDGTLRKETFSSLTIGTHNWRLDCVIGGRAVSQSVSVKIVSAATTSSVAMWINDDSSPGTLALYSYDSAEKIRYSWSSVGLSANPNCKVKVNPYNAGRGYNLNLSSTSKNGHGTLDLMGHWLGTYTFWVDCNGNKASKTISVNAGPHSSAP